jgi:hypothetical protein
VTDHAAAEDHASVVERPLALQLPDLGLPPARNSFRMESGANVITGDGATLLGDHYVPDLTSADSGHTDRRILVLMS